MRTGHPSRQAVAVAKYCGGIDVGDVAALAPVRGEEQTRAIDFTVLMMVATGGLSTRREKSAAGKDRRQLWSPRCGAARPIVLVALASGVVLVAWLSAARAATVRVLAPISCVEASTLTEQVDALLGRPIATVEGVAFDVEISEELPHRWKLRFHITDLVSGTKRSREILGRGCAELADAAAVAVTMSINSTSAEDPARRSSAGASPSRREAEELPQQEATVTTGSGAAARTAAGSEGFRPALAFGMVADAGALPGSALGVALEAIAQAPRFRAVVLGGLFPSQSTSNGSIGGAFQLAIGGALACATGRFLAFAILGCGGGEVGRLWGEGSGVTRPRLGSALWAAGRIEAGGTLALGPRVAIAIRGGIAIPVSRPVFVVDQTVGIHQPARVIGRAQIGIEIGF